VIKLHKLNVDDPIHGSSIEWLQSRNEKLITELGAPRPDAGRYENNYRDPRVKCAVMAETHDKCAYCESKSTANAPGDVEHILPKAGHPERLLDYHNFTFVCSWCNICKGNKEYVDGNGLLNPYIDEPNQYVFAAGPMLLPSTDHANALRGIRMIDDLKLDRTPLLEQRAERLKEKWSVMAREYHNAGTDPIRNLAAHQIKAAVAPDSEYSMFALSFFELLVPRALL